LTIRQPSGIIIFVNVDHDEINISDEGSTPSTSTNLLRVAYVIPSGGVFGFDGCVKVLGVYGDGTDLIRLFFKCKQKSIRICWLNSWYVWIEISGV